MTLLYANSFYRKSVIKELHYILKVKVIPLTYAFMCVFLETYQQQEMHLVEGNQLQ